MEIHLDFLADWMRGERERKQYRTALRLSGRFGGECEERHSRYREQHVKAMYLGKRNKVMWL